MTKALTVPRGCAFHFNQNLLQVQKEGNGILRNTRDQRTLSYPFLCVLIPCITIYTENDVIEGRGKVGQSIVPFPFSPSLLRLVGCMHIKKGKKNIELVLCSIYTVLISTKYIFMACTSYKI